MRAVPGVGPQVDRLISFIRSSYRRKLAVALLAVFLVTALAVTGLYVQVGGILQENVEGSMTASANAEAGELAEWDARNRLVAQVLSEHPVYGEDDPAAVREYLREQRATREETVIVNAYLIDQQSRSIKTSTDPTMEGTPTAVFPWTGRIAFDGFDDVHLTRPYETEEGRAVVAYVTPIRQDPESLLVVTTGAATVFDEFEEPIDGGFTRVVDSNGTVVFADEDGETLQPYYESESRPAALAEGLGGNAGFIEDVVLATENPDERHVVAYAPVEDADWVVIKHAPANEAYAIVTSVRGWIGVGVVFMITGFLGVVVVLGTDVTRALSRLTDGADRIRDREYDATFETDRPDEFGELNRAFATTRDALQERITEIQSTQKELERSNAALQERSEMISVLNRVLRHNVRNDVNVIAGRADLLANDIEDEALETELATIREKAFDLAQIAERTRRMEQLLAEENTQLTSIDPAREIQTEIVRLRSREPDATIRLDVADGTPDRVNAITTLPVTIADVIQQIHEHNDEVTVKVRIAPDTDPIRTDETETTDVESVRITIDDDGDGVPAVDIRAVESGSETPLKHADGIALWCLKWAVERADGSFTVDQEDATIEVKLRAAQ